MVVKCASDETSECGHACWGRPGSEHVMCVDVVVGRDFLVCGAYAAGAVFGGLVESVGSCSGDASSLSDVVLTVDEGDSCNCEVVSSAGGWVCAGGICNGTLPETEALAGEWFCEWCRVGLVLTFCKGPRSRRIVLSSWFRVVFILGVVWCSVCGWVAWCRADVRC